MDNKVFVPVTAEFGVEGGVRPISLRWEDGRCFDIDRVVDVRRAASLKAGGQGMRYICMIKGKRVLLFREEDRWFIEKSEQEVKR